MHVYLYTQIILNNTTVKVNLLRASENLKSYLLIKLIAVVSESEQAHSKDTVSNNQEAAQKTCLALFFCKLRFIFSSLTKLLLSTITYNFVKTVSNICSQFGDKNAQI